MIKFKEQKVDQQDKYKVNDDRVNNWLQHPVINKKFKQRVISIVGGSKKAVYKICELGLARENRTYLSCLQVNSHI